MQGMRCGEKERSEEEEEVMLAAVVLLVVVVAVLAAIMAGMEKRLSDAEAALYNQQEKIKNIDREIDGIAGRMGAAADKIEAIAGYVKRSRKK